MFDTLTEKLLIIAGAFLLAVGLTAAAAYVIPEAYADATAQVPPPAQKPLSKDHSTVNRAIAACSTKSWPYYDSHCLAGKDSKPVRVIAVR